ncbi:hypothetical protein VdG1_04031 [Verticillium dahliae VDG1]|nr:hypothetical protein VdG1_04031 [Verticillium dahliae VDG1]
MVGEKHNVATTLNYWDDPGDGSKPTPIFIGEGRISNKRPHKAHEFVISDISGEEDQYTLDQHGFQYLHHASIEKTFADEERIKVAYYEECRQLLTTHVDQSYDGAERRLRWEFPSREEADELVKRRYQIINIWRPIEPIFKDPIAVAAAPSVPDADLAGAEMTEDGFVGESWVVRHNPEHKWFYKHRMTPRDVLLIKCFDSDEGVARRALHSAFEDPAYATRECRQSIEVRALVCY